MNCFQFFCFFSVIAVQPHTQPYLNALLPKDQDLDSQHDIVDISEAGKQPEIKLEASQSDLSQNAMDFDSDAIDNPYLRPIKMPKFKKKIS